MTDAVRVETPVVLDLLDNSTPSLSTTSDMPVIETQPDSVQKKEETPAAPVEAEKPKEPAPEDKSADPAAAPKESKGVQKRIDELVQQREEAKRQAEAERAEKLRLLALVEAKQTPEPAKPKTDEGPVRPRKEDYDDPNAYDAAVESYIDERAKFTAAKEVENAIAERDRKAAEEAAARQQQAVQEAYVQRVEKVKEKYADYSEVAESPDVTVSMPMAVAIVNSEQGPELAYYFGKNPKEAARITALPPHAQLMELGKIEVKLASQPATPKPISNAPPPIKPQTPSSDTVKTLDELSMDEYAAKRRAQLAEERRPGGFRH